MTGERDKYGRLIDEFEQSEEFMLNLHTLVDEAGLAGFSPDLIRRLEDTRLLFVDQFEARFPGKGKGRAVYR